MSAVCHVVASSRRLVEVVVERTGSVAEYIPEPYELPEAEITVAAGEPRLLWFGHSAGLSEIRPYFDLPNLTVCTNAVGRGVVSFSRDNLIRCLRDCDVVIIPQSKDWKSANRMVESLRAGRFVVASDIPAYRGFSQYLGDMREGIEWSKSGPITERIISGRRELPSFSPQSVGRRWFDFISAAVERGSGATST